MSAYWKLTNLNVLEALIQYLRTLPLGRGLKVYIEKPGKTPEQRAYFHCVVRELTIGLRNYGHNLTEADVKEMVKRQFCPRVEKKNIFTGLPESVVPSTEDLSKEDYSTMIDKTLAFAASQEITIHDRTYYGMER